MLDQNGLAAEDIRLQVFHYNTEREFSGDENLKIEIGTGLPANSTLIQALKSRSGFSQIFNEIKQKWEYIEDHRGEKYFSITDGFDVEIKELGGLPNNVTSQPRPSVFHVWDNGIWTENQIAKDEVQKQQNISFLAYESRRARDAIGILDDAVGFDMATDKEIEQHKELKKYRIMLSRITTQPEWPLKAKWPECPEFFMQ